MLGRKAENKFYIPTLIRYLNKRSEQMAALHFFNEGKGDLSLNFSTYNQCLRDIQDRCDTENQAREAVLDDFLAPSHHLRVAAESLKRYQSSMMLYRHLSLNELRRLLLQHQSFEQKEPGSLSLSQIKNLRYNKEFFLGKNFYDILQARLTIKAFSNYLKKELRFEVERYHWSFFQRLSVVIRDPMHLWSMKGWRLLRQKKDGKQKLIDDLLELEDLCDEAMALNATQFQYCWQAALLKDPLSLREQESIKSLLLDASLQKQLVSSGVIHQADIQTLSQQWQSVFYKVNQNITVVRVSEDRSPRRIVQPNGTALFLDKIQAIYDSDAAFRYFGLRYSLLDGHMKFAETKWGMNSLKQKEQRELYQFAIKTLYFEAKNFLTVITIQPLSVEDSKAVLALVDIFTQLLQNNETKLISTKIGTNFLDVINHLQQLLLTFQTTISQTLIMKEMVSNYSHAP